MYVVGDTILPDNRASMPFWLAAILLEDAKT